MKGSLRGIWPFAVLFAVALFLRFYNIGCPFSVNGIDEGNDLMAGKLAAAGFSMYSQINTMQAPLFLYVYSLLDGNIVACRSLSAVFSVLGILGVCLISRRIASNGVALVSGVFVAFNFYYLKEARLASMDLFASVLLIWGFLFLTRFTQGEDYDRANLFVSGCLFAMASMTKLFAVIPTIGVLIHLVALWLRRRRMGEQEKGVSFLSVCVLGGSILIVTLPIMVIYGFGNSLTGMFLNHLHKPGQPYLYKLLVFSVFFCLLPVPFIFGLLHASRRFTNREVQLLLVWIVPLLGVYLTVAVTWVHHYTIVVPPLCILGGLGLCQFFNSGRNGRDEHPEAGDPDDELVGKHMILKNEIAARFIPRLVFDQRRGAVVYALCVFYVTTLVVGNFALVLSVRRPVQNEVADDIRDLTSEADFLVCGDPIITNYAGGLQVPELACLARIKYPPITSQDLIRLTKEYEAKVVVFTYDLSRYEHYLGYIQENYIFLKAYDEKGDISSTEGEIAVAKETFNIYVRAE